MKNCFNPVQNHTYSRPAPFRNFSAQRYKQGFNVFPHNVSPNWIGKNRFECFPMFSIHTKIISKSDTTINF